MYSYSAKIAYRSTEDSTDKLLRTASLYNTDPQSRESATVELESYQADIDRAKRKELKREAKKAERKARKLKINRGI